MSWLSRTLGSSVGAKMVMGVTGLMLFLFLVAHLTGNLLTFAGEDAFNTYAAKMQSLGPLLWLARGGLLAVLVVHVAVAMKLARANCTARPVKYAHKDYVKASYASRTMVMTGLITFAFICFHLAHYTLYWVDPSVADYMDAQNRHDAYRMLVLGFQNPLVTGTYIVAMLLIGLHLSHGLSSLFQSLGLNHPNFTPLIKCAGPAIAWLLVLGFISIPVSVLFGIIRLAEGVNG